MVARFVRNAGNKKIEALGCLQVESFKAAREIALALAEDGGGIVTALDLQDGTIMGSACPAGDLTRAMQEI